MKVKGDPCLKKSEQYYCKLSFGDGVNCITLQIRDKILE